MAAGGQRHGFFIVHGHAGKGFADVARGAECIHIAVRAFWVHVDQTHLHSSQRISQLAVACVALVVQPFCFRSPVDVLFWLPNILTPAGKAKGLETHRIQRDIARQHHQICP